MSRTINITKDKYIMNDKPNDRMIKRGVDIWCKKLFTPVFDNGDNSEAGGMAHVLATMNILNDKAKIDDMPEKVEIFREALTDILIKERDENEYFRGWLSVDYGPCTQLHDAAEIAGIPDSQFSIKSDVSIRCDCVSTSFGYAADHIYHYPLEDGKWLLTSLSGSDIDKIIASASKGNPLDFIIE
jgi:hypothetical protein